ncbi:26S PROTEASOME ZETA CHAIN [Encephalitozoon cuniculi GB-M1]|uniref:Probable proteasome subunit alpha type-5 n=2 Tax=Encephalitozoon cuniculi TaxID=6035 RepID=PSA5_ENCCU|nr:proteasome core particle subunit alpha 5 [Encephalitozoon cuniculi GB-M1]Q8SRU3.1 RecName: Full=Probable proteasome subunit alpha type-5; AltName: Full=26S proteasome alpha-type subunit PUP2; AltName: Full=Multicatalytic endopeptidase complex subunit PUP2 [Encephalitozoon cuniculi GB-M1]AGE95447.1 26S proteasome zeta chain [Encephalitozoon cuniculi]KMV66197.1 putative proteasome alpha subunit [Encephalitozoon cuniculi EcunIII-L]UYI27937.1 proteasome subunit [Encephalitozoon cuniculi]CAD2666
MEDFKQSVNTYSSEGRIHQIEYAMKAMNLGTTTIGVRTKEFVILCSEKKILSTLQNPKSVVKHYKIYDHIVLGFSGISGDTKTIVKRSRDFCISHTHMYGENISVERLLKYLSSLSLRFGEEDEAKMIFRRPFGVSLIIAGFDTEPRLYSLDPSGSYISYKAKAIGSGHEVVEGILENEYEEYSGLDQSLRKVLCTLSKVMKDKISKDNVEVVVVTQEESKFLTPEEVSVYL